MTGIFLVSLLTAGCCIVENTNNFSSYLKFDINLNSISVDNAFCNKLVSYKSLERGVTGEQLDLFNTECSTL